MRAAAILGPGCSGKDLKPFQTNKSIEWQEGLPTANDAVDVIVLFGGDGTIHRYLSQLVALGVSALIVPAGSGNDFARALGIRRVRDSLQAWQRFLQGVDNMRTIDLGTIFPCGGAYGDAAYGDAGEAPAPHYFASIAGLGLDAEVMRRANGVPRWLRGNGGYVLSLLPTIFHFAPFPLKIYIRDYDAADEPQRTGRSDLLKLDLKPDLKLDLTSDLKFDRPTMLAAFANAPFYGSGMKIAPRAKMDDGLLDVCVIEGIDPFKLFCLFPTVYGGRHLRIKEVHYFQTRIARVETEHPMDVYADGEYVCRTPVEIGVQSAALTVITPANHSRTG